MKLNTLPPRLKELTATRIKPLEQLIRERKAYPKTDTKRHTKAGNGRTLRLDSAAWRKLRRSVLACEPLCRHCTARGLTVIATDVDHRDNDPSNNELVNLVPLCHSCHSRKTALDMGGNVKMGCDLDGRPLDPNHHWNEKSPETFGHKPTGSPTFNADCKDTT